MRVRHIPREASRLLRRALGLKKHDQLDELLHITASLEPGDTFVDIGAHEGTFSLEAGRKVGPHGTVLAIEPNPQVLAKLRENVAASGLLNIHVVPMAIGDQDGEAILHVFKQHTRSSLHPKGRETRYTLDDANRTAAVTVAVKPLLSVLSEHRVAAVRALKIDVEGYEDRVLVTFFEAAPPSLWPQHVLIERSPHVWKVDCIQFMQGRGYRAVWESRGDTLLSL